MMPVRASEIARMVGGQLVGEDCSITRPCIISKPLARAVGFLKEPTGDVIRQLEGIRDLLVIVPQKDQGSFSFSHVGVNNPRLAFARILEKFFVPRQDCRIAGSAMVAESATVGNNVSIGEYCVVGPNVVIGEGTEIRNHVVIAANVKIGRNCLVKSHAVIGEEGFGMERDEEGNNHRVPQVGSVIIGDNVEIGIFNVVASGTVEPTVIENYVKCADHVHIDHNCRIGSNSILTAGAVISGSVILENNVWIGPNSSMMQNITIGHDVRLNVASLIFSDCEPDTLYSSRPSQKL